MIGRCRPLQRLLLPSILGLMPGAVLAQLPPPLPSLLPGVPAASCVSRFGNTGCAALLYAQVLCDQIGSSPLDTSSLQQQLAEHYEQAAIDFRGITADQVETAAIGNYAPQLCPSKSEQIRRLFRPS